MKKSSISAILAIVAGLLLYIFMPSTITGPYGIAMVTVILWFVVSLLIWLAGKGGWQDHKESYGGAQGTGNEDAFLDELEEKYKDGWRPVENSPQIVMKRGETCHKMAPVQLYEYRSKTKYVGGSAGVSFRVAKGVTLRTGRFKAEPVRTKELQLIDEGVLHVTSQRVVYAGHKKTISYPLNKILSVNRPHTETLQFLKENDSSPKLFYFNNIRQLLEMAVLAMLLVQNSEN